MFGLDFITFITLIGIAALLVIAVRVRTRFLRVVVQPHETVLVTKNGRDLGRFDAGVHRFFGRDVSVRRFDLRETLVKVGGQEVLTRDRVPVKLSLLVRQRVVDPLRARDAVDDLASHVHAEAQLALREGVGLFELDELLAGRAALSERVTQRLRASLARAGLEITDASVQDVMVGGELKRAFGEVVRARSRRSRSSSARAARPRRCASSRTRRASCASTRALRS
jgi:regulator of protease activity HflC (stomatin/prohibitin superfamily)